MEVQKIYESKAYVKNINNADVVIVYGNVYGNITNADNVVVINGNISFKVNVNSLETTVINEKKEPAQPNIPLIVGSSIGGAAVLAGVPVLVIFLLKRRK